MVMFIDLFLLFLPIPRWSFLQELTGKDTSAMLRYHKCAMMGCGRFPVAWPAGRNWMWGGNGHGVELGLVPRPLAGTSTGA